MKWTQTPGVDSAATAVLALLLGPLTAAAMLHCEHIQVDGQKFNLQSLGGPHSVVTTRWEQFQFINTTYTLDICAPLRRKGDVAKGKECPNGARVCAIQHEIDPEKTGEAADTVHKVISIAGDLRNSGGDDFDWETTRLSTSDSHSDSEKEGIRLVMMGGKWPLNGPTKEKRPQKAIVEFLCDPNRTGLEGEWRSEDEYEAAVGESARLLAIRAAEGGEGGEGDDSDNSDELSGVEHQLLKDDTALIWDSYGPAKDNSDADILRLTWYTKFACESLPDDEAPDRQGKHWGFFTWLVILVFLATASYLIFGSWLNYNRYGARGWDLLPHGDTIRDIPYLLKDWTRSLINTLQGSGSRGGYSAV